MPPKCSVLFPCCPVSFAACVCCSAAVCEQGQWWREAQKRGAGNWLILSKTEKELREYLRLRHLMIAFLTTHLTNIFRLSSLSCLHIIPPPQPQLFYPQGVSCCVWREISLISKRGLSFWEWSGIMHACRHCAYIRQRALSTNQSFL